MCVNARRARAYIEENTLKHESIWEFKVTWMSEFNKYIRGGLIVLFLITGYVFVSTCWRNRLATREGLFEELSDYELIVKEFDPSMHSFSVGNFSLFKQRLQEYNISTVYVEPYSGLTNSYIFYYVRNGGVYRSFIDIEIYGICRYRLDKSIS